MTTASAATRVTITVTSSSCLAFGLDPICWLATRPSAQTTGVMASTIRPATGCLLSMAAPTAAKAMAVRAQASLALARFLSNRSLRLDVVLEQPALAREFADLYGKDYLEGLRRRDRAKAAEEAEALLVRATRDYGDVKLPDGETVAEKAGPELFGIRHLSVGKVAPDIEGVDQDGVKFKLSDYRGKVVLLDFWSEY